MLFILLCVLLLLEGICFYLYYMLVCFLLFYILFIIVVFNVGQEEKEEAETGWEEKRKTRGRRRERGEER
jgi:hypothetical protein